jgi:hypothetical protein
MRALKCDELLERNGALMTWILAFYPRFRIGLLHWSIATNQYLKLPIRESLLSAGVESPNRGIWCYDTDYDSTARHYSARPLVRILGIAGLESGFLTAKIGAKDIIQDSVGN